MFNTALESVLKHEGYYVFNPSDKGGETYRGIARNFHPDWPGWVLVDREKESYGGVLRRNYKILHPLMEGYVANFYKTKFWDRIYLDKVKDPNLQYIIFDAYVNSGGNGITVLQRLLNSMGQKLAVDGAMGVRTVQAVNSVNAERLFNSYKKAREDYYRAIARGTNAQFLQGWLNRIRSFSYKTVGLSVFALAAVGIGTFFL